MRVLVVGNDARGRRSIALALRRKGVCVVEAAGVPNTTRVRFDAVTVVDTKKFFTTVNVVGARVFRVCFDEFKRLATLNELTRADVESLIMRTLSHKKEPAWLAQRTDLISNQRMGRIRILILEDDVMLRDTLKRCIVAEATALGVDVVVDTTSLYDDAIAALDRGPVDVFLIDACLGHHTDRSGLKYLEVVRARNIESPAFVLTGLHDYDVEARADALRARYVPKEGLNLINLVRRILTTYADSFRPHDSSVRLKKVTVEDAASYLAHAPNGVRNAYLLARRNAVLRVLEENGGNRTAAAKTLGMTRQQVQEILREDREEDLERKAR